MSLSFSSDNVTPPPELVFRFRMFEAIIIKVKQDQIDF